MEYNILQNKSQSVIERLLLREATKEVKEFQQTVASDGANSIDDYSGSEFDTSSSALFRVFTLFLFKHKNWKFL